MNNIDLEKIESFKLSMEKSVAPFVMELKQYAIENDVPIISDEVRDFLDIMIELTKPAFILEIGTAIGYSALSMANHECIKKVITIENYHERVLEAELNLIRFDKLHKVQIIEEDASIALDKLLENECFFDFIFLDSAKSQYINWLPKIKSILKKGGIFITDNVFNDKETLKSRFVLPKRSRSMHDNLKEYLLAIKKDKDFYTKILNVGDGISFVMRNKDEK